MAFSGALTKEATDMSFLGLLFCGLVVILVFLLFLFFQFFFNLFRFLSVFIRRPHLLRRSLTVVSFFLSKLVCAQSEVASAVLSERDPGPLPGKWRVAT